MMSNKNNTRSMLLHDSPQSLVLTIEGHTERQWGDRMSVLRKKEKISNETCSQSYAMNPGMNSYCEIG